ncbi:hypothetical protein [Metabacillus litoralis]|uniref:hypothetical protein n=1 Tax=Metabacillus litoralis TaxID=152268 RepID=UPI00203DA698|nr:hypothetical protein [Metabacillus litoralis]MCM3408555.1 hypothetical protein [Metabacillus litoralis]
MSEWYGIFIYMNLVVALLTYIHFYKRRKLIGFHLGMNIAMVAGGSIAICTGVILINQFPLHFLEITIIATLTGIIIGSLFGGLFDYQTLLTGFINGLMMGIMSPMIGAAASGTTFILFLELCMIGAFGLLILSSKNSS